MKRSHKLAVMKDSAEKYRINQAIVKVLRAAAEEYKDRWFTRRFEKVLRKQLTPDIVKDIWGDKPIREDMIAKVIYADKGETWKNYRIYVCGHDIGSIFIPTNSIQNYSIRIANLIDEFDQTDQYQWEIIRSTAEKKLDALNAKVLQLRQQAREYVKALPRPEHNVLNRCKGEHDLLIEKAYPSLFQYLSGEDE